MVLAASAAFSQAPQEKSVTVFGAKINYVEAGDPAKPKVILLHGLGGSIANWALTTPALAQNYHVSPLTRSASGSRTSPR